MDFHISGFYRDLREQMIKSFSLGELRLLANDLSVDWETLPGESKAIKTHEFILYLDRRERVGQLMALLHRERPKANWPGYPPGTRIEMYFDYQAFGKPVDGEEFFTEGMSQVYFTIDEDNSYFDEGFGYSEAMRSVMDYIYTFELEKKGFFSAAELSVTIKNLRWSWDLPEFSEGSNSEV
ncbi:MAG: hypothetical protein KDE51_09245 [Anaerolineales bacterium]|nr:hypothetical protein [Anaerolineales bacterium]